MADTKTRSPYMILKHTGRRDVALLILLLGTGIRADEASRVNGKDIDLEGAELFIWPFGNSGAKTKRRVIPLGKACLRAL